MTSLLNIFRPKAHKHRWGYGYELQSGDRVYFCGSIGTCDLDRIKVNP